MIFAPVDSDERAQGTIIELEFWKSCTIQTAGTSERTTYDGTDVFDIRPAATVECSICRELRRDDEMNRQSCCRQRLCVVCDAKEDKCAYCRKEKA